MSQNPERDAPEDQLPDVDEPVPKSRLQAVLENLGEGERREARLSGHAAVKRGLRIFVIEVV